MKTIYKEIEITYDEKDNRWHFELRGRQRWTESLAKAKEAIDKPVNQKEEKPFVRCKAYLKSYNAAFAVVEVTSVAESRPYSSSTEVWVVDQRKNRSKEYARNCYPVDDKNTALVAQWRQLDKEAEALSAKRDKCQEKMQSLEV